jgi:hypothetical protein
LPLVGDRSGQLHGKTKTGRYHFRPSRKRVRPVRTIKRRVDLGGVQAGGVTLETASAFGKAVR